MNKIDLIIENIEYSKLVMVQAHKDELLDEALDAARELKEANADMLSALRAIVAVAETEKHSFSMHNIKNCANIAIKQARGEE
jgi:hypothetical protein